jgi:flagellar hook assembly protein FlgD
MITWLNVIGGSTSTPSLATAGEAIRLTAFPNPFRSTTTFSYRVPSPGFVTLRIVDVAGRHVRSLVDARVPAGTHTTTWSGVDASGRHVTPGIYFVSLDNKDGTDTQRVVVIR